MRTTLFKHSFLFLLLFQMLFSSNSFANRELAITIDDLPFVGASKNFHLDMILNTIKTNEVPATGFIIAGQVEPRNWEMLQKFREAGIGLGNHTFSHRNLNMVNSDTYIQEIEEADRILKPVLSKPKYFRFPYLAMSKGEKKTKILDFLASKHYRIAPITIDSKDFIFNQLLMAVPEKQRRDFLKVLKPCYLNFIWQQTLIAEEISRSARKPDRAQILLIHANLLNAYVLGDIINLYKQNNYNFVSLNDALETKKPRETPKAYVRADEFPGSSIIDEFIDWD
ncbi:MAG: polysaccharide deacetylase family protein [Tatlockia sp.]|nr:polysaccharide deacetylase family protein [Tatlockia sp.]